MPSGRSVTARMPSGLVLGSILWIVGLTAFFGWLSARLYRKNA